jgi:Peptidase family M23
VAEMESLSASEEAALEGLILERERELEAQQRAAGIAGGVESGGSGTFAWPVTGTITSPFGWRSNPFGGGPEFHQGLDIAAPMGTTVTAAAAGTVIMAQWYGGYGNYILMDTAIYPQCTSRAGRPSSVGKPSARSDRLGSRPGPTFILKCELRANRLTRRPGCIKT